MQNDDIFSFLRSFGAGLGHRFVSFKRKSKLVTHECTYTAKASNNNSVRAPVKARSLILVEK